MGNNNQNETVDQNVQTQAQPQGTTGDDTQAQAQAQGAGAEQPKDSELLKANAELQMELRKQKKMIDQYSSQISALKKELSEKIANEGAIATQQTEEIADIKEQLEKANKNIAFRDTVESYMALGMDKDYATKVAQMKMDGEEELVNSSLKAFLDSERKRVKEETTAELYAKMPAPVSGNGDGQIDYNKIYTEKLEAGDIQGAIHAQLMGAQQKAQQS